MGMGGRRCPPADHQPPTKAQPMTKQSCDARIDDSLRDQLYYLASDPRGFQLSEYRDQLDYFGGEAPEDFDSAGLPVSRMVEIAEIDCAVVELFQLAEARGEVSRENIADAFDELLETGAIDGIDQWADALAEARERWVGESVLSIEPFIRYTDVEGDDRFERLDWRDETVGTARDLRYGLRVLLSWGGPSDGFDFILSHDAPPDCCHIDFSDCEYFFHDWFDGASRSVAREDSEQLAELFALECFLY